LSFRTTSDLLYPELSYKIRGSAFDVYNELGSGHNEKYYQKALAEAFYKNNLKFCEQLSLPISFNNKIIGRKILDFLVEDIIVVEIKKGDYFSKKHIDQVLNYLKLTNEKLAILANFSRNCGAFKRIVNIDNV
jgi:GxxExxY protein